VEDNPDYTQLDLKELYDLRHRIDRDRDPERFAAIACAIDKRENEEQARMEAAAVMNPELIGEYERAQVPRETPAETVMAVRFHGSAWEYFRIWIVNLCLSLVTFGIFSAWAKVRKKRYFYSHTTLDGTPFQYLGRPIPILKGRLIAAAAFLTYYLSTHLFTSALPYVFAAGVALAPWMVVRSAAFNARYSAYRNMVFHYGGTYLDALKALYAWGLVPAVVLGMIFDWWGGAFLAVAAGLFGLFFPWWLRRFKNLIIGRTSYGGRLGFFSATGGQFFMVYLLGGLIVVGVVICAAAIWAVMALIVSDWPGMAFLFIPAAALIYFGYVLSYAYIQAHNSNLVWNSTHLGPLRFRSTLQARKLVGLYVTNALGIIASVGLLTPWAVMRTMRYRAEHLEAIAEGDLAAFQGSYATTVQAAGAEIGDFFDVDLSL